MHARRSRQRKLPFGTFDDEPCTGSVSSSGGSVSSSGSGGANGGSQAICRKSPPPNQPPNLNKDWVWLVVRFEAPHCADRASWKTLPCERLKLA